MYVTPAVSQRHVSSQRDSLLSLQELRKQTENPELQADITNAINAIQTVLDAANVAIDKEHLATAVADLAERVDDWKSLKVDSFGELLRFGTFIVVKGDTGKDSEREVLPPPPHYEITLLPVCTPLEAGH